MAILAKSTAAAIGDSYEGREKLNAMAVWVEWETSRRGDNDGVGRIPALFATFAEAICKRGRSNRLIRRRWGDLPEIVNGATQQERVTRFFSEANEYRAIVDRHVSLKLEKMIRRIQGSRGAMGKSAPLYFGGPLRNTQSGRRRGDASTLPPMDAWISENRPRDMRGEGEESATK